MHKASFRIRRSGGPKHIVSIVAFAAMLLLIAPPTAALALTPPVASNPAFAPSSPRTNTQLEASTNVGDVDDDDVGVTFAWSVTRDTKHLRSHDRGVRSRQSSLDARQGPGPESADRLVQLQRGEPRHDQRSARRHGARHRHAARCPRRSGTARLEQRDGPEHPSGGRPVHPVAGGPQDEPDGDGADEDHRRRQRSGAGHHRLDRDSGREHLSRELHADRLRPQRIELQRRARPDADVSDQWQLHGEQPTGHHQPFPGRHASRPRSRPTTPRSRAPPSRTTR